MSNYIIGPCLACNQRAMASFRCARVAELVVANMAPVSYFDRVLDELVELYATANETHLMEWTN